MTALLDFPISILFSSFLLLKIWVIKTGGSVLGMAATSQYLNFQFFLKLILRVIYCCRLNVFSLLGYWPHSSVPSTAPENEGLGTNSSWLLICSLWHFFASFPSHHSQWHFPSWNHQSLSLLPLKAPPVKIAVSSDIGEFESQFCNYKLCDLGE